MIEPLLHYAIGEGDLDQAPERIEDVAIEWAMEGVIAGQPVFGDGVISDYTEHEGLLEALRLSDETEDPFVLPEQQRDEQPTQNQWTMRVVDSLDEIWWVRDDPV